MPRLIEDLLRCGIRDKVYQNPNENRQPYRVVGLFIDNKKWQLRVVPYPILGFGTRQVNMDLNRHYDDSRVPASKVRRLIRQLPDRLTWD